MVIDARRFEAALIRAFEAQPETDRVETDRHGDKLGGFKVPPRYDANGMPIMPVLNLSRIAEIMESELA